MEIGDKIKIIGGRFEGQSGKVFISNSLEGNYKIILRRGGKNFPIITSISKNNIRKMSGLEYKLEMVFDE